MGLIHTPRFEKYLPLRKRKEQNYCLKKNVGKGEWGGRHYVDWLVVSSYLRTSRETIQVCPFLLLLVHGIEWPYVSREHIHECRILLMILTNNQLIELPNTWKGYAWCFPFFSFPVLEKNHPIDDLPFKRICVVFHCNYDWFFFFFSEIVIMIGAEIQVSVLPGSVLSLIMSKPHGFRYKSGQYIFLKCPTISPFEWFVYLISLVLIFCCKF